MILKRWLNRTWSSLRDGKAPRRNRRDSRSARLNVEALECRVMPDATSTMIAALPTSIHFGQSVTLTATISDTTSPGTTPNQDTVTFTDGATPLAGTVIFSTSGNNLVAQLSTTALAVGTHSLNASYAGDDTFNPSSSTTPATEAVSYAPGDLIVDQVGYGTSVVSASVASGIVTVTTTDPIPYTTGQFATIAGNSGTINGSFAVTVTGTNSFTYSDPSAVAGTGGTVSNASKFTVTTATVSGSTVSLTTSASTGFLAGQQVTVSGNTGTNINGTFTITSISGATLKYTSAGATAGSGGTAIGPAPLSSSATAAYLRDFSLGTQSFTGNTVSLPTGETPVAATSASWASGVVTLTTASSLGLTAGQTVNVQGVAPGGYNGTFVVLSVPTSTTLTYAVATNPGAFATAGTAAGVMGALTLPGTTTTQGYLTDSLDGHSVGIAGYAQVPGGTTSTSAALGVVGPTGTVNASTVIPSAVGSVTSVISVDGSGMYVSGSTGGIRYVSFGGTTPSIVTGASWAATNGGTATITAPNVYLPGQSVVVAGITGATGFNGTFTVLSATASQFTYALATNPGTATVTGATSQLMPTALTNEYPSAQEPVSVTIGTGPNGQANEIYGPAGAQFQNNGIPSIDGPATIGTGLVESGGQSISAVGSGTGQNFPNSMDLYGNFPTTAQISVSPDGNTIFVADSRTDSLGGILEYYQTTPNQWKLFGHLQVDSFAATSASEVGTTVTVNTPGGTDFYAGESVSVFGLSIGAYDGTFTVLSVSPTSFTYTGSFTGLAPTGANVGGATATSADGGFRGLAADYTDGGLNDGGVILYATTSNPQGNRLLEITGGNSLGNKATLSYTVLATAAPNVAFRGVAFAPTATGTTGTTTSLSVSGSPSDYASGVTLQATVTSGATGWVSFVNQATGIEIGSAPLMGNTATLVTSSDLAPGAYSQIVATYTGDGTYAPSTSSPPQSLTITKTSTTTSLNFSPTSVGTAQSETLTAVINVPAGVAPTSLVTFTNTTSSTTLGTAPVNQVIANVGGTPTILFEATFTVPAGTLAAGTYNISAAYSGDNYFSTSTGTGSLSVVNSTTTTVTSSLANPTASPSQSLTLTATVTSTVGTPNTGTVTFYDDLLTLGTTSVNGSGVATLTVPTSLVQQVTVLTASAAGTTVTITTDANNPMVVGEQVTVEGIRTSVYNGTFTVTAVSGNSFSYVDSSANNASTDTDGGVAIGLDVLTPGLHAITAIYTPTGAALTSFAGSTGVHEQTVQALAFGTGDIYQERNGDGISSLNTTAPNPVNGSIGTPIYVDELTPSGTLIQSLIVPTADSQSFVITSAAASGTTVTITTSAPTDYAVGTKVTIAGITTAGYNGDVFVTAVSNPVGGPYTFTYTSATSPTSPATLGASPTATGVVHAVVGDGQQSTTGQMSLSGDGQYLFLTGYDNNPLPFGTALPVPTAAGSQNVPRDIAQISFNGTVQTEAFAVQPSSTGLNSGTGAIFDGVYSPDGNQFYVSGFNGIYYFPSVVTSATLQGSVANQIENSAQTITGLESYGGNLYAIGGGASGATSTRILQIGTGLPVSDIATITGATWSASVATISAINNFAVGQSVLVAGLTGSSSAAALDGAFTITTDNGSQVTYAETTNPGTITLSNPTASLLQSPQQLPGIPVSTASQPIPVFFPVDAYFTHTNPADTGLDTIYIADDGKSFGAGGITKWSLNSSTISNISEPSGTTATITLMTASLGLTAGESVPITISGSSTPGYNGTFTATVTSPTTFTITTATNLGTPTTLGSASGFVEEGVVLYSEANQQLGFYYLAGTTTPGGVVTLYSNYGNGGNADFGPGIDYSFTDSNGANNYPGVPVTAAAWSGGTVTITAANTYLASQDVNVEGIVPSGYDGQFIIASATPTQFTYALAANPGTTTSTTGAYAQSLNTISTVAFEGVGSGYAGKLTYRGLATAPEAQTFVLVDNGPNPSTPSQSITFSATVASPGSINVPGGTVTLEDASNGNVVVPSTGGTLSNGSATLTVAAGALSPGTHNLFAVYSGDPYHQGQISNVTAQTVTAPPIAISSISVDGASAPILSATSSGGVATITTDGPSGFTMGQSVLISGVDGTGSATGFNGTYTIASVSGNSFTFSDIGASGSSTSSGVATTSGTTGMLTNGATAFNSQRSMVDSIVYTFNQAVNLLPNAVTITATGQGGVVPTVSYGSPDGGVTWVVTFSGSGVVGNSIANGEYQIVLNAADVTSAVGGAPLAGNDTETFYRLYGDTVGNGHQRVNTTDTNAFLGTFNLRSTAAAFLAFLDSNNDGRINTTDTNAFLGDFNIVYRNFTASI